MSTTRPILAAFHYLRRYPAQFFGIWLAVLPALLIERVLMDTVNENLPWGVIATGLVLHAVFFLFSAQIAAGATLLVVQAADAGAMLPFSEIFSRVRARARQYFLSSLVLAVAIILGIFAFVLPGVIVMTLYAFVPFFIVSSAPLPLMAYFDRSLKASRRRFAWLFFGTALGLFVANVADFAGPIIGFKGGVTAIVLSCLLAYVVNIVTQVWLACNFKLLKGDGPV